MRLSENMTALLLLAHGNSNRPTLQSAALAEVYGLPPRTRLRQRPGRFYSSKQVNYHTARASLTRSLRRLELGGLIERKKARSTGGASYALTAVGRELAARMEESVA